MSRVTQIYISRVTQIYISRVTRAKACVKQSTFSKYGPCDGVLSQPMGGPHFENDDCIQLLFAHPIKGRSISLSLYIYIYIYNIYIYMSRLLQAIG